MTSGDKGWLVLGAVCFVVGLVLMVGTALGTWTL